MPLGQGRQLDSQEYADIVAYILAQGGVPAGGEKLTPNSPMDRAVSLLDVAGAAIAPAASRVEQGKLYDTLKQPSTHKPTQTELDHADSSTDNWLMYNKGYRGERYSLLARNTSDNAAKLHPLCMFQLGTSRPDRSSTTVCCASPLMSRTTANTLPSPRVTAGGRFRCPARARSRSSGCRQRTSERNDR